MVQSITAWLEPFEPLAGPISALAAIVTALVAVVALHHTARDSHERTRPIVIPYAQAGPSFVHGALYLVVKNFGATPARNVQVTFNPPLPETVQRGSDQSIRDRSVAALRVRYQESIAVVAPGQRLVNIWTNRAVEHESKDQTVESPDEMSVTVSYEDHNRMKWPGFWRGPQQYSETVPIRMKDHDMETKQNPGSSSQMGTRKEKAMEAMAWELW